MNNQQVYFENIRSKILELLESAKYDIIIAVAWITDTIILKKLLDKSELGVQISIVFYDDRINNKNDFKKLFENGVKIKHTSKLMHNKFCVIDRLIVINGSYNWTNNASKNHENIQVTTNSLAIAQEYINEFNKIFNKSNSIDGFFKSETDKFNEYLHTQVYPSSFPCFLKLNTNGLNLFYSNREEINHIYVLIINDDKYKLFHERKFDKKNFSIYDLSNFGWYFNIYNVENVLIDYNQNFIPFVSAKMIVIAKEIQGYDRSIYIINQQREIISPKIWYCTRENHRDEIQFEADNILLISPHLGKIWHHRNSLLKNELLNTRYKTEEEERKKRILRKKEEDRKEKLKKQNSNSCYIATMVYKDINHPKVQFLRLYRDEKLNNYYLGRKFINLYYKYSPTIVTYLKNMSFVNLLIKTTLDLIIKILKKEKIYFKKI